MPDKKSSASPRHPSRVVRRRLREAEMCISADTMRQAMGWVLEWLRLRTGRSAAQVSRQLDVVPQTVRDIEEAHYEECGWTKVYRLAHAMHRVGGGKERSQGEFSRGEAAASIFDFRIGAVLERILG
jgi:hypothetical protein